jgi:hypothetical protein
MKRAPRHTRRKTQAGIIGIEVVFRPDLYGVTSWTIWFAGRIVGRFAWERLALKHAKKFMRAMG